jgi:hypothetical protein
MTYGNTIEIPSEFVNASYQSAVDENGKIVIVNSYGKVIYSVDGIHWDYSEIPVDSLVIHNVIYANNKFFAVGTCITTNHGVIAYSSDAISWTTITFSDISVVLDIAYGNGKFIATTFSNKIITSTDGISWTSSTVSAPRT